MGRKKTNCKDIEKCRKQDLKKKKKKTHGNIEDEKPMTCVEKKTKTKKNKNKNLKKIIFTMYHFTKYYL